MKITRAKILIATSIVPQILLMKIISLYPEKVELYFSQIFYPKLFNLQQFFVDPIPFSIGDLIYLLLGVYIFYLIVRFFIKLKLPSIKILAEIGALGGNPQGSHWTMTCALRAKSIKNNKLCRRIWL